MTRTAISPRLAMRTFLSTLRLSTRYGGNDPPAGGRASPHVGVHSVTPTRRPGRSARPVHSLSRAVGCVPCRRPGSPTSAGSSRSTRPTATCSTRPGPAPRRASWPSPTTRRAGRGRLGRSWEAPPGANLLLSVLLRPRCSRPTATSPPPRGPGGRRPVAMLGLTPASPAADAVPPSGRDQVAQRPRGRDGRKLAGVLAESDLASAARRGPAGRRWWSGSAST